MSATKAYKQVMEATGFYRNNKPAEGIIEARTLESNKKELLRRFKYNPIIDPDKLNATAIFELHGSPCVYFTELKDSQPSETKLQTLRSFAWNHGLAPLLWVVTPSEVLVYDCYAKPLPGKQGSRDDALIRVFTRTAEGLTGLNDLVGRTQLVSGRFWESSDALQIDRRQRVDASLLDDLQGAENMLVKGGLSQTVTHALLSRSIFSAYLQDRGILDPAFFNRHFSASTFIEVLNNKSKTYQFFAKIHGIFNGDLFPLRDANGVNEQSLVHENHLEIIRELFAGTQMATGQGRLWPYKFDVIPVELISSIYEMFAHADDSGRAKERSTHYTPINLVDLVLSQTFNELSAKSKVLDLSCGSGVFLVEALRRLVALRFANGEAYSRQMIRDTLYNQIFGVDISEESIRISAFSLYLTALELDPKPEPLEELRFEPLIKRNLFAADAFDENAKFNKKKPFANKEFGVIVGNPPWTKSAKQASASQYCLEHNYPLGERNPPDQAFLWRSRDFANDNTRIALIMAARPFFALTPKALRAKNCLIKSFNVKALMNLADLRNNLFSTAKAPAMVLIAEGCKPSGSSFTFVCPEWSESFKRHGIIEIRPENIKRLSVSRALSEEGFLKIATWGNARDAALIKRLADSFPSLQEFIDKNGWQSGQGIQEVSGKIMAPWLYGKRLLRAGEMPKYQIDPEKLEPMPSVGLHRPRRSEIFKGPLIITRRGGLGGDGFGAAFCPTDIVYQEDYFGISASGSVESLWLAHYINALLNSPLAAYFLFMTGSVWGVEREEVKPVDLKRLPIPLPDESNRAIVEQIIEIEGRLRTSQAPDFERRLGEMVAELYGLDYCEKVLVRDGVDFTIDFKMKRQRSAALKPPNISHLKEYANYFSKVLKQFLETLGKRAVSAEIFDLRKAPLQVIKFSMSPVSGKSPIEVTKSVELENILSEIADQLPNRISDYVYTQRVLRIYADKDLYIVKPSQQRYWSASAALNDADAVIAEHMKAPNYG